MGYEVDAPMTTFTNCPPQEDAAHPPSGARRRAAAVRLYSRAERSRQLLKVSGIGAKIALAILSSLSADELALAVAGENVARLSKVPGIAKPDSGAARQAGRGRQRQPAALPMQAGNDASADITHALLALGYNDKEASAAVKTLPAGASWKTADLASRKGHGAA